MFVMLPYVGVRLHRVLFPCFSRLQVLKGGFEIQRESCEKENVSAVMWHPICHLPRCGISLGFDSANNTSLAQKALY